MDDKQFSEILESAISTYGIIPQMHQCTEEMAELIVAMSKYRRADSEEELEKAIENFIEEIADVYIMLQQMIVAVERLLPEEGMGKIKNQIDYKVNRLKERIENEQRNVY